GVPPARRVLLADRVQGWALTSGSPPRQQLLGQQPGALERHADALGDNRVGFAGTIAHLKNSVIGTDTDARLNWPGRKPGPGTSGAGQRPLYPYASVLDLAQHSVPGLIGASPAQRRQPVPANAARERHTVSLTVHHAAVAAGEGQ